MPISQSTLSDLKKTTAQFDFLLSAQNIKIKNLPHDAQFCVICQEPFDNSLWQQESDAPVNRPVKLECGHVFGIQCLAHLVFTSDFSNRCPLCRAKVMPDSYERNPSGQSWKAAVPLLRILMMFVGEAAAFEKKKALDVLMNGLEREGLMGSVPGKHMHRIMVLYEEFLNQFCDAPQPPDQLAASEARVHELEDILTRSLELDRVLEESRELEARRQESEISELKGRLEAVHKDRGEVIEELQRVRTEGRAMFFELKSLKEEQEKAKGKVVKKPTRTEKGLKETQEELKTCKKDLENSRNLVWELRKAVREATALLAEREREDRLRASVMDFFASSNLQKEEELKVAKKELADATSKIQAIQRQLNAKMEASGKSVSYSWALTTLEAAMVVVLVHFAGHLSERSVTSISMVGLMLVQCIVTHIRLESKSRFWSVLGSCISCVALGLVVFSEKETFVV